MAQFVIEIPHAPQGCSQMLDSMAKNSPDFLSKICWGCMANDHVGWGMVEAMSETEVRIMLPPELRDTARITEVNKYTAEDIRRLREAA
jgi:hypothetical protein